MATSTLPSATSVVPEQGPVILVIEEGDQRDAELCSVKPLNAMASW